MTVLFSELMGFSGIFRRALTLGRELAWRGLVVEMATSCDQLKLPCQAGEMKIYAMLGARYLTLSDWLMALYYYGAASV